MHHTGLSCQAGMDIEAIAAQTTLGLDLFEGDIKLDGIRERNSIIGDNYRWPHVIPYVLDDSLEMNAKGLILKAFEQYRLKTCIDFKPWEGEENYISVFKGSGCWSSVGNRRVGLQQLSIGANCDRIATIQHEFLHALGFWHEQSRSDRDDYVSIVWERIQSGTGHNFNKYDDKTSDSLNVPYDYNSVMHYSKNAFRNGTEPTIITNIPDFMDVIGQRMDFSDYDLQKLNRLYNCTSSLSFMDTCSFELENICGMIQSSDDNSDWQRLSQVPAGPNTDHTNMGECEDSGYFMHFNTSAGAEGSTAILESRILYPKRGFQCLQFYFYNSGHESDHLYVWVREYTSAHPNGTLRLVGEIKDISHLLSTQPSVSPTFAVNTSSANTIKPTSTTTSTTRPTTGSTTTTTSTTTTSVTLTEEPEVPNSCPDNHCENDGVCVLVDRAPVCRCPAGDNWWYMGEKCERKGSTQENTVIAVSSTVAVFVVMLIVTITTAVCLKKKYSQGKENGENMTLENRMLLGYVIFGYFPTEEEDGWQLQPNGAVRKGA
ncbi:hypothetical protein Q9233_016639 [Columba guinea]|nr:hypothetical protein Q9233_016639 [Columba guinea]